MMRFHTFRRHLAVVTFLLLSVLGSSAAADVVKIVINDTIHPITDEFIGRALQQARETHADALLIELRTPGGLVDSTRSIIEKILASPVPVIVYVTPSGARAASAGFFILQAADIAAMSPGTNTGAAHPVIMGATMDPVMKEKMENDAAAFMRSFVAKRGRNVDVAESAVRASKSFTEQEGFNAFDMMHYNLLFRWDWQRFKAGDLDEGDDMSDLLSLFFMLQRKGGTSATKSELPRMMNQQSANG